MSAPDDKPRFARNINSGRPFKRAVWRYRDKGWLGTMPLPPKEKHPPPGKIDGKPRKFTGRNPSGPGGAPYPTNEEISTWLEGNIDWAQRSDFTGDVSKANIGLHLGTVEFDVNPKTSHPLISDTSSVRGHVRADVIGVDVDDYVDGKGATAKVKTGMTQLRELEARFGPLPPTWRSSSREGLSGIRFFLVSSGLAFRGKASEHIDIVNATHKFAVVFPSYHPSGGQYVWYRPDDDPDGLGEMVDSLADLPDVKDLPCLPTEPGTSRGGTESESWLDFLTRNRTRDEGVPMDMDTDAREIVRWAKKRFVKSTADTHPARFVTSSKTFDGHGMCARMTKAVANWKKAVEEDPSSHDKIAGAHWNLLRNGMEGHTGWEPAVREIERYIVNDVKKRSKRGMTEVKSELYRSKTNCLRKIKGEVDTAAGLQSDGTFDQDILGYDAAGDPVDGIDLISASCTCFDDDSIGPGTGEESSSGAVLKSPGEYDTNDDGNAAHFIDLYMTDDGPSVRFIADLSRKGTWMVWDAQKCRWQIDDEAGGLIRRRWWKVKDRQVSYVKHLRKKLDAQIDLAAASDSPLSGMNAPTALVAARNEYQKWAAWAEKSGNNDRAAEALKAAAAIRQKTDGGLDVAGGWRVTCTTEDLNGSKNLLGVANGIIDLGTDPGGDDSGLRWPALVLREALPTDLVTMNTDVAWYGETSGTARRSPGRVGSGRGSSSGRWGQKLWNNFLDKFLPDPEIRRIAQIAMGSTLYGGNSERAMLIFIGLSSTGKSTFSEVCAKALGAYGGSIGKEAFQGHKFKPTLILNKHKRFVINSEFDANVKLSTAMIKEATGNDGIPVERKGLDEVDIVRPHFTPGLATNKMPRLTDPDTAVERRIYPIHFNEVIEEDDPDLKTDFADKLKEHALEAVFAWLVEGYSLYRANGGLVRNELTNWWRKDAMAEIDDISLFISQCLIVADNMNDQRARWQDQPKWCATVVDLYARYESWFYDNDYQSIHKLSKPAFSERMKALGYWQKQARVERVNARFWMGIQIRNVARETGDRPSKLKVVRRTIQKTKK